MEAESHVSQRGLSSRCSEPEQLRRTGGGTSCWEESMRLKMKNHEPAHTVKENQNFDIIPRKTNQLPEAEKDLPEYGSTYIGLNATLCGLIAVFFVLNVAQARIAAGDPIFDSEHILQRQVFVSLPLNTNDLNCENCIVTRD